MTAHHLPFPHLALLAFGIAMGTASNGIAHHDGCDDPMLFIPYDERLEPADASYAPTRVLSLEKLSDEGSPGGCSPLPCRNEEPSYRFVLEQPPSEIVYLGAGCEPLYRAHYYRGRRLNSGDLEVIVHTDLESSAVICIAALTEDDYRTEGHEIAPSEWVD